MVRLISVGHAVRSERHRQAHYPDRGKRMNSEKTTPLSRPATRRAVVKTGAKIAYGTPLVAAAFKLSTSNVHGQLISPECTAGDNCITGEFTTCGGDLFCACVTDVDGGFACVLPICTDEGCTTGADCASGTCITAPGCCSGNTPFCGVPCQDAPPALQGSAKAWRNR